ncbi:MAG: hypothetical protein PUC26_05860 [Eubacteriales bacterium]|nr:hypothetical protein [Eubacteriales bacterium]
MKKLRSLIGFVGIILAFGGCGGLETSCKFGPSAACVGIGLCMAFLALKRPHPVKPRQGRGQNR